VQTPRVEIPMRRALVLILLSASLLSASLLSAPSSPLKQLWSFLASVWEAPAPTPDAGCGLDPNGKPICQHGS
jgi:hypothetical protein